MPEALTQPKGCLITNEKWNQMFCEFEHAINYCGWDTVLNNPDFKIAGEIMEFLKEKYQITITETAEITGTYELSSH